MTEAPNVVSARLQAGGLSDVLAGVLRRVHLNGAVFLRGEFTAPWAFFSNTPALKAIFAPASARLVLMHLAVEGCFRSRAVGVSPMRYLAQWRLRMASELLRNTPLGMTEVAGRVGYESDAAFSRAFKRHFGTAPAVWRRHTEAG